MVRTDADIIVPVERKKVERRTRPERVAYLYVWERTILQWISREDAGRNMGGWRTQSLLRLP